MATILHFAGTRFELADSEDPRHVEIYLAKSDGTPQEFGLKDGCRIRVHAASHSAWVLELRDDADS